VASHAFEEHTGEVRLRLDAATLGELFAEAARALAELVGTPAAEPPGPWRPIAVDGRDRDALLVAWLDELIARTEIDHLRYADVVLDELTPQRLAARIRGTPIAEPRTAVKAATLHGLRIETGPRGATATVVLDV
jgi:SHS2 domain-containing protein